MQVKTTKKDVQKLQNIDS